MLMVEKTVPDAGHLLTGSTYVMDVIVSDLADAAKDTTLYSPGGFIETSTETSGDLGEKAFTHSLVGDTSEGHESDDEINEVFNFRIISISNEGRTPPQNITSSQQQKLHINLYLTNY